VGITQADIAEALGVSRAAVNHVVRGLRFTPRIVAGICGALAPHGRTRADLFPELEEKEPCA